MNPCPRDFLTCAKVKLNPFDTITGTFWGFASIGEDGNIMGAMLKQPDKFVAVMLSPLLTVHLEMTAIGTLVKITRQGNIIAPGNVSVAMYNVETSQGAA